MDKDSVDITKVSPKLLAAIAARNGYSVTHNDDGFSFKDDESGYLIEVKSFENYSQISYARISKEKPSPQICQGDDLQNAREMAFNALGLVKK